MAYLKTIPLGLPPINISTTIFSKCVICDSSYAGDGCGRIFNQHLICENCHTEYYNKASIKK